MCPHVASICIECGSAKKLLVGHFVLLSMQEGETKVTSTSWEENYQ